MEQLPVDEIIKFRPDTLYVVRKDVNLEKTGRIDEAVDILEKWVKLQPHFLKKDFSREYIERLLITAKGLVERAKERFDKLCIFKTIMPELFTVEDMKEFTLLKTVISTAHLPRLTPEHYRVYFSKVVSDTKLDSTYLFTYYKYLTMLSEYFLNIGYCTGFVVILDYTATNLMSVVSKINPIELRQMITLMTDGYGLRIKGIHIITPSKMADTMLTLLKQVFSAKLTDRMFIHKSIETVYKYVPKEILPSDFGGDEKTLEGLHDQWLEVLNSKKFLDHYNVLSKAKTNESLRPADKFNESYVGMPGSFRALSVD